MTVHEKEVSRQRHLQFTAISSFAVVLVILLLVYLGKDVGGLAPIIGAWFVAIYGKESMSLYTKPS